MSRKEGFGDADDVMEILRVVPAFGFKADDVIEIVVEAACDNGRRADNDEGSNFFGFLIVAFVFLLVT